MSTLSSSHDTCVEVPALYSRQKAIKLAGGKRPVPHPKATDMLYVMFMKIGAINELPSNEKLKESYLNDFWITFYFDNHLCPGDIPFHIIIEGFTKALVQGYVERKGNNQAAICQAFNKWITRQDVRNNLYEKRDQMYPEGKPKQIPEQATQESIKDYSDEELQQKIDLLLPMKGLKTVDMMIERLEQEKVGRGL